MWSPVRNVTGEASVHAQHKFGALETAVEADFVAYNKLTTGLEHDLRIFTWISKFCCFYETKQAQNDVERFFLELGRICFRILLRQSENFSDFCRVLFQFAFHNMIVPLYTSSSTCAQAPLHPQHKFLQNSPPSPNCYCQISLKHFWY